MLHHVVPFSSSRRPRPAHLSFMPDSSAPDASSVPSPLLLQTQKKLAQIVAVAPELLPVVDDLLDRLLELIDRTNE